MSLGEHDDHRLFKQELDHKTLRIPNGRPQEADIDLLIAKALNEVVAEAFLQGY